MSGDLGNLLTGELGEAEARFSHEDFAADFGKRIAGRVRRRRAVRAAGVGGGTMLTAGALAVGATHIPWGVLGAAPGMGGSDCVTTSPSTGATLVTVTFDGSDGRLAETVVTDPATGGVRLRGIQQSDGTWRITDADGNQVEATPGPGGGYVVNLDGALLAIEWPGTMASAVPSDPSADGSFTYTVVDQDGGAAAPGPSEDCYTPSPTPSAVPSVSTEVFATTDPSLAAKPEDVTSPFQCGFEFPTESSTTDGLWIDGAQWITGAEAQAAIQANYGEDPSQAPDVGTPAGPVPVVTTHFASTMTGLSSAITFGTASPTVDDIDNELAGGDAMLKVSASATYVGVADGRVVAIGTVLPGGSWTTPPVFLDFGHEGGRSPLYLLDQAAALTSCEANPVDFELIDLVAVAGVVVKHADGMVDGPTYAWLPVGKP